MSNLAEKYNMCHAIQYMGKDMNLMYRTAHRSLKGPAVASTGD